MDDVNLSNPLVVLIKKYKRELMVLVISNILTYLVCNYINEKKEDKETIKEVVVEISGSVNSPGIYKANSDQRVGELIDRAGGFTEDVDAQLIGKSFNLSKKITDEEKIYIPYYWEAQSSNNISELAKLSEPDVLNQDDESRTADDEDTSNVGNSDGGTLVNINKATKEELDSLPGIGPVYAQRIVDGRPYSDSDDFEDRSGLSKSIVDKLESLISY